MKTEPSEATVKVKLEKNETSYSSSSNTPHPSVKQETKVHLNLDLKPSIKTCHDEIGGSTSVTKVTRVRKVRRKTGARKTTTTKRKSSTYTRVKRKTKGRRKRRTTKSTTTKTRRKRTTKKLVTGKALTPRQRICKKLGIERNLSLGVHSLPTIRKMTQENSINHKRAAAGIGVLSIFGSELNSHGSVPLRDEGPDVDTDLSGVDERSPLPEEHEDSLGPNQPLENIPLEEENTEPSENNNVDSKNAILEPTTSTTPTSITISTTTITTTTTTVTTTATTIKNNDTDVKTVPETLTANTNNSESTYDDKPEEALVIDVKPQVNEILADQPIDETPQEDTTGPTPPQVTQERETTDPEESKSKLKRCKHGKIIHGKKHESSKSSKRSSSKDGKAKEDHKSSLLKTIKKEPRDRDDEAIDRDSRENRSGRTSLPNRHEVDYPRRLTRSPPPPPSHEERTSRHRENDRNRENHLREDRGHSDKRKRLSASKERLSPVPTLPLPTSAPLSHLPPPTVPPPSSSHRSRVDDNSSKNRSSSSHRRDSSRNNRSPTRKESRRTSPPHHEPLESRPSETKKKFVPEEEEKSKGKKKKRKHKHKHSKYHDEDDYNDSKSAKHFDPPVESSNGKRIPSSEKLSSTTNNSRHEHHHKKSKRRHHSREGRSSPTVSSHKVPSSPHREEREEKSSLSRSRSKRTRHSSPSERDHLPSRHREDRRDPLQTKSGKISTSDQLMSKDIKVKLDDNHKDCKDHKDHPGIPATTTNPTNTNPNVNNVNSKASRSPSEVKSVLSKPGSPPKKDVRLVSKSRTEFDIFWDENSQNKKVDGSHVDFDPNNEKLTGVKEETGLRFLPRTLLSGQASPKVHLPPTVGPRTPPDEERAEKSMILSSPDQTMPTPTQDESLEGDYSNGTPTKQQGSIKSLDSPSVDPDIYDPEAPLESSEDDQLIKSEIARSQAKLNEMEKKLSPCRNQIPETLPRPGTPEPSSPRPPLVNNNNTPTNSHKFKSPIIPPLSSSSTRAPTLAESSLPPAPGSLLAQIQQTLNLQAKVHSSHSDSKQPQPQQPTSGSSSAPSTAPTTSTLSPSIKSLLENLIKAAEQQQSKSKSTNVNSIFKKPAPVLDSKSRSISHSHHHSAKTKVNDRDANKKVTQAINLPLPGTASQGAGIKIPDATVLDDVPSSAVELQVKEKYLKKLNRQERVVEEVKMVLKPFYQRKEITKDEYKEIMRKAVPKVCHSKSGEINPQKVRLLVESYIQRYKHDRKKSKSIKGK